MQTMPSTRGTLQRVARRVDRHRIALLIGTPIGGGSRSKKASFHVSLTRHTRGTAIYVRYKLIRTKTRRRRENFPGGRPKRDAIILRRESGHYLIVPYDRQKFLRELNIAVFSYFYTHTRARVRAEVI